MAQKKSQFEMKAFEVHGPFEVPLEPGKHGKMVARDLSGFWTGVGDVRWMRGVYVFAMRAGRGYTPLYVGKAAEQSFEDETFALHKLAHHYGPTLLDYKRGQPVMFFIAHPLSRGAVNKRLIDQVETFMIDAASAKNPSLSNVRKKQVHKWRVCGVVRGRRGEATRSTGALKKAVGLW
ncbi:hypothetical protein [Myxococcus qinghaiensis]|uniref:hypothetical protein n=1 Tax=Myxococcus qinghaiensis TaxID=2906758 RepID=UPI0020A81566|nr:hypothetical protein [Myxococcus qinghaiensis]MCP3167349.1 hypothetical protein [Myxococcus qinghaiensis]